MGRAKKVIYGVILLLMIVAIFMLIYVATSLSSKAASGNVSWRTEGGVLYIEGEGDMTDVSEGGQAPWYTKRESITKIIVGDGITAIGARSFIGFSRVTEVILPASVSSIGERSFSGCTALARVELPLYLTDIEEGAFFSCGALCEILLPNGCRSVGAYAFASCEKLKRVVLPQTLVTLGEYAFFGAAALTEIQLPSGITVVPEACFRGCTSLEKVSLPSTLTALSKDAFYGCTSLKACALPVGVSAVGESAFQGSGLCGMILPSSVRSIGDYAFASCRSLTSLTLPSGLLEVPKGLLLSAERLTDITIPSSVERIGDEAFSYCLALASICIPERVRFIGDHAFAYDSALQKVDFNATSCFVAGSHAAPAFRGCVGLSSFVFGEQVSRIPDALCMNLPSLSHVTIGDGVLEIGTSAFEGCGALQSVELGDNLQRVGEGAFYRCPMLVALRIPSSLRTAGYYAFFTGDAGRLFAELPAAEEGFDAAWCGDAKVFFRDEWVSCSFYAREQLLGVQYLAIGESCEAPHVPNDTPREGYTAYFNGWDLNGDGAADALPLQIRQSFRADALYRELPNRYQCRFYLDDGSLFAELSAYYGDEIPLPQPPTKESDEIFRYIFLGWSGLNEETRVNGDMRFTAQFEKQRIDRDAPTVGGITADEIYYSPRQVTVTDTGLSSVLLDGEELYDGKGSPFVFRLPKDGKQHVIVTKDASGNTFEITVTSVEPVAVLSTLLLPDDAVVGKEEGVNQAFATIDALLSAKDLSDEDREHLKKRRTELFEAYRKNAVKDAFAVDFSSDVLYVPFAEEELKEACLFLFGEEEVLLSLAKNRVSFTVFVKAANEDVQKELETMAAAQNKQVLGSCQLSIVRSIASPDGKTTNETIERFGMLLQGRAYFDKVWSDEAGLCLLCVENGEGTVFTPEDASTESVDFTVGGGASFAVMADVTNGDGWVKTLLIALSMALLTSAMLGGGAWLIVRYRVKRLRKKDVPLSEETIDDDAKNDTENEKESDTVSMLENGEEPLTESDIQEENEERKDTGEE